MIKDYYSANDLLGLVIDGLPMTKVGLVEKMIRENWPFIEVVGRGGKRKEYAPPAHIREQIERKFLSQVTNQVRNGAALVIPSTEHELHLTFMQKNVANARAAIAQTVDTIMKETHCALFAAANKLLDAARNNNLSEQLVKMLSLARDPRGRVALDEDNHLPSVSSLIRFYHSAKNGQLAPKKRGKDMRIPDWYEAFQSYYSRPEKPTVEHAYQKLNETYQGDMPSIWAVRRFLHKIGNVSKHVGRMGKNEIKNIKPFMRRSFEHLWPADVYAADGHCFDAEVQHPFHNRAFRPEITTFIDVATRKVVGFSIGLAESALDVLSALRSSVHKCGVPAILYVDNGSGYRNRMFNDEDIGLMSRLGVQMSFALPYNSQAKGVIERVHQTLWVKLAKEVPNYIGKDMDRQARLVNFKQTRHGRKIKLNEPQKINMLNWDMFLELAQKQVEHYNDRPHRSLKKITCPTTGKRRHQSPNERWAECEAEGFKAEFLSDAELIDLFRPQERRKVLRCEIRLFDNVYFNEHLEELHGEYVAVAYDLFDPQYISVYDKEGRLICRAELDANKSGFMPQNALDVARMKRSKAQLKRLDEKYDRVIAERDGIRALPIQDTNNVVPLVFKKNEIEEVEVNEVVEQAQEKISLLQMTASERYKKWVELEELKNKGENITDEFEKRWYENYPQSSEYQAFAKNYELQQDEKKALG